MKTKLTTLGALLLALSTVLPAPTHAAEPEVERHGSFAGSARGFMGCLRAADGSQTPQVCLVAYETVGGVHVTAKSRNAGGDALFATSYFESVTAPAGAVTTVVVGGVPRVHLDVELPRTGHVVVATAPMWSEFAAQHRDVQVQCGISNTVTSDDGAATISAPSYDEGTVDGKRVVNADACSFYWVGPASGWWSIADPTNEGAAP